MTKRSAATPNGFAVVDKDTGWTSHDVVARARKHFDTRKVGHSGTLDPSATGVLVLGVGRATKLLRFVTALPKRYHATFQLGVETTTLDADGEVTERRDVGDVGLEQINGVLESFVGQIQQVPPMVSAVKIDGRRLHELAREGKEVDRPARTVTVHELTVTPAEEPNTFAMDVSCSSGTYVRSIAADIGSAVGTGAHVRTLRRNAVGSFVEAKALPVDQAVLISMADGLRDYAASTVNGEVALAVRNGRVLACDVLGVSGAGPWAVHSDEGALLAVYELRDDSRAKPAVVVAPASD
ncbi:MAG: tRNA pseudouridine(55) synthase TruB [Acidimicrobiales bacterium]